MPEIRVRAGESIDKALRRFKRLCREDFKEMKRRSWERKVYLGDSSLNEHTIVFYRGEMVQIICPSNACQ